MIGIKVTGLIPKTDLPDLITSKIKNFMKDWLDLVLKYALENLKKNESWVTGHLGKSGRVDVERTLTYLEGELLFGAPYAAYLEFGTRAHAAPLGPTLDPNLKKTPALTTNPLDYWAWKKGCKEIVPCKLGRKFYGYHTSLGWAVWLKILARGTDPHPYLRPAIDRAKRDIPSLIKKHKIGVD